MADNINKDNKNSKQNRKNFWSKMNFYSCLAGVLIVLACCLVFIISLYCDAPAELWYGILISLAIIALAAVVLMILSWYNLRGIKKSIAKKNEKNSVT